MDLLNQELSLAIETQRAELAQIIVAEQWRLESHLNSRFGEIGQTKCTEDVKYNLAYLAHAIAAHSPTLFADYINWVKILFDDLNIPPQDLMTSLEITANILQQRFPGEAGITAGKYIEVGLAQLTEAASTLPSFIDTAHPLGELAETYLAVLLRGERQLASRLILQAAEQGVSIKEIYLQVFSPCLYEVGRLWQMNRITVAQEHYCTAATQLIMSQLYQAIFATEKTGGSLVATCVSSELHEVGLRMVADFFEMDGWDTYYLGANVPTASIVKTLEQRKADMLAISATITFHVKIVTELIQSVRAANLTKPVKILVGGYPFNVEPNLWQQIGADGYARNAQEAVATAHSLITPGGQDGL